ncbi:N(alpha)-acetyltransferase 50, NatE catalytic subunit [Tritrichomonas foetus]|uniref:N(Alpha)-acetyltransferase 50, NatE catalytic subunit n=1 Tax=Tritrichomonas foetus TaxID=1144522 RepID=A0A1J4L3U5_9EUKA|nr:N(alpha)-acetyltransferase 50, NatE catalytic subunit [Tritrichomonas foetus]|eukprot:OHT16589.1 N(alpha)-acetyltransferase 50, NatE catalytic subunit [Tritrichomonas foetus]
MNDPISIHIIPIDHQNISQLKILHQENFNMNYPDYFYNSLEQGFLDFGFYAQAKDIKEIVGEITLQWKVVKNQMALYVCTLSVSPKYRRQGIASKLLDYAISIADNAHFIYLHTECNNFGAQNLYKNHGFIVQKIVPNYYDSESLDAYKMRRENEYVEIENGNYYHIYLFLKDIGYIHSVTDDNEGIEYNQADESVLNHNRDITNFDNQYLEFI